MNLPYLLDLFFEFAGLQKLILLMVRPIRNPRNSISWQSTEKLVGTSDKRIIEADQRISDWFQRYFWVPKRIYRKIKFTKKKKSKMMQTNQRTI